MPTRRKRLNLDVVRLNIAEAIEELQQLEHGASTGGLPEGGFAGRAVCHAYRHLNVAWNARRVATREFANLSDKQFDDWSRYPSDIEN